MIATHNVCQVTPLACLHPDILKPAEVHGSNHYLCIFWACSLEPLTNDAYDESVLWLNCFVSLYLVYLIFILCHDSEAGLCLELITESSESHGFLLKFQFPVSPSLLFQMPDNFEGSVQSLVQR